MMEETIKEVLMRRDDMDEVDAEELIAEAKEDLQDRLEDAETFGDPEDICIDWFGLEMDYIMELLP